MIYSLFMPGQGILIFKTQPTNTSNYILNKLTFMDVTNRHAFIQQGQHSWMSQTDMHSFNKDNLFAQWIICRWQHTKILLDIPSPCRTNTIESFTTADKHHHSTKTENKEGAFFQSFCIEKKEFLDGESKATSETKCFTVSEWSKKDTG